MKSSSIIGIQFSIMSPDQIRKSSVAKITSKETYNNNKPVIGGVFDPRMGVLEPEFICPTDGLNYINCPGYFGHLDLARPVFYIQYLSTIVKLLKCICLKCSKLLINKDALQFLLHQDGKKRWINICDHSSKIKRCGDENDDGCGYLQPSKIKKRGSCHNYC
jgi:DNA-directed RNA polymerase II subunit RPB1